MKQHWLAAEWPAPECVRAGTTLRTGGSSTGPYNSLNVALHVGDRPENVRRNREKISSGLALPAEPVWLQQVHGCRVVAAELNGNVTADAVYSRSASTVCAVMTADCLPVLLCAQDGSTVAAVHGGWRGLLGGVLENTIAAMEATNLLAWLGPAIGPESFEVGPELRAAFIEKDPGFNVSFKPGIEGKWLADIYSLARVILRLAGVSRIYGGGYCTVIERDRFFSYRRDGTTGRMASLIWLTE